MRINKLSMTTLFLSLHYKLIYSYDCDRGSEVNMVTINELSLTDKASFTLRHFVSGPCHMFRLNHTALEH